jgi:hypothetical protein
MGQQHDLKVLVGFKTSIERISSLIQGMTILQYSIIGKQPTYDRIIRKNKFVITK